MGFDEFSSLSSAASELISACKFEAEVKIESEKVGNKLRLDVEIEVTVSLGGKFKLMTSSSLEFDEFSPFCCTPESISVSVKIEPSKIGSKLVLEIVSVKIEVLASLSVNFKFVSFV